MFRYTPRTQQHTVYYKSVKLKFIHAFASIDLPSVQFLTFHREFGAATMNNTIRSLKNSSFLSSRQEGSEDVIQEGQERAVKVSLIPLPLTLSHMNPGVIRSRTFCNTTARAAWKGKGTDAKSHSCLACALCRRSPTLLKKNRPRCGGFARGTVQDLVGAGRFAIF